MGIERRSMRTDTLRTLIAACAAVLLAACGSGGATDKGRDRPPPLVKAEPASTMRFVDAIEAVGTAMANEQVTVSAPVTERIVRLNFDDGSFVRQGQVLAVLQQGQQTAQLAEIQAREREARQQLERVSALKERGFATQASFDQQAAAAAAARAQAEAVRAQIGERVVRAPFSGWVSLRNISVGTVANQGTDIATISDISLIKLDFPVPETMLGALRPGLGIEAVAAAWPGQPFRGTIHTIDTVVDPATRAVTVRARIPNPDRRLRPGMMMTVAIETAPRMALAVPELAVIGEGDARYVYVLDDENRARRVSVRTGQRREGRIEIMEGLEPGQRVVTEGVVKVSDGMTVRVAGADNARPARPDARPARPEGGGAPAGPRAGPRPGARP
jgi:membrane fusion protein, multidrug efflux system